MADEKIRVELRLTPEHYGMIRDAAGLVPVATWISDKAVRAALAAKGQELDTKKFEIVKALSSSKPITSETSKSTGPVVDDVAWDNMPEALRQMLKD